LLQNFFAPFNSDPQLLQNTTFSPRFLFCPRFFSSTAILLFWQFHSISQFMTGPYQLITGQWSGNNYSKNKFELLKVLYEQLERIILSIINFK
jgi:hypothetical protein